MMKPLNLLNIILAALFSVAPTSFALAVGIDSLKSGEWYAFPNSQMNKVNPCPSNNCSYSGNSQQPSVMDAWSGGAYDSQRDRLVVWGGGHWDYAGNEIYVFDVNSGVWSRASEPSEVNESDPSPPNTTNYYHDGKPSARHTYNYLAFAPNVNQFFSMGSGASWGANGTLTNNIDSFDFSTGQWKSDWVKGGGGSAIGAVSAYDAVTGSIWFHGSGNGTLVQFSPAAAGGKGAVTTYPQHIYLQIYGTAAIDTKRHQLVVVGGYGGERQVFVWNLNNPSAAPTDPKTSGDAGGLALESGAAVGFDYDPVSDRFIGWNGGTTVFALNPGNWSWTRVNASPTNTVDPGQPNSRGTYGRFRYIPSKNAFIVANRTDGLVYAYKLVDTIPPSPSVSMTATPSVVSYLGTTTINWTSSDAFACTPSGDWAGTKELSGSESLVSLTKTSTFSLACSGFGGNALASTTVTVSGTDQGGDLGSGGGRPPRTQSSVSGGGDGGSFVAMLACVAYSRVQRRRRRAVA